MEKKRKILLKKIKINKKHPIRVISTEKPKFKKIKLVKSIRNQKHRPTSALANQNINNISHLFKNNHYSNVDILWTLNLRNTDLTYDLNNEKYLKNRELMNHMKEPSFYQEDLEKYVNRKIKKSKSTYTYEVNLPTLNKYSYLFKNKLTETHGTILNNTNLLNFELTLRTSNDNTKNENINKNNKNDEKKEIRKIKWNNNIYKDKKKDLYTVDYNKSSTSDKLQNSWLEEKYVNRPYKIIYKKIRYNDNKDLMTKVYIRDKEKAYNKLGDTFSYKPYNDKYTEKNINNIENLLNGNNKSQQNVWFQLSLREDLNKKLPHKFK